MAILSRAPTEKHKSKRNRARGMVREPHEGSVGVQKYNFGGGALEFTQKWLATLTTKICNKNMQDRLRQTQCARNLRG